MSGPFSSIVALIALAVSLASAGWSVFAFAKASEVRPLQFEYFQFLNQQGVPQIALEVPISNLAYGQYDDVARVQEVLIENGERRLRFVARRMVGVQEVALNADGSVPALDGGCYWGGALRDALMRVCTISSSAVTQLPAGEVVVVSPVFELAREDCGLTDCRNPDFAAFADMLRGEVRITYTVRTMRDGNRTSPPCVREITQQDVDYYISNGWFGKFCQGAET